MNSNPAAAYRQVDARGATPVGLIVLTYDAAANSIHAAMRAISNGDVEQRTKHLNHLFTVIGVLQSALDYERGGEVARRLGRFYDIARAKTLEASMKASPAILEDLAAQFLSIREAWAEVENQVHGSLKTAAVIPTPTQVEEESASCSWSV